MGSIVGSTDAAAVFAVLRSSGLKLPERLTSTLEVESGSNDPMAIFLTLGLIGVITGTADSPQALLWLFVGQFGVGTLAGLLTGRLATWSINRINLDYPGLYPLLALAFGLVAFGLAAVLGGSGFLAVYIAGIVLGSSSIVFRRGIFSFHDATAWLAQIVLFVMLGLLSFPSRLLAVAWEGLLIALVLILVARPLAVWASALPFHFRRRELTFWQGCPRAVRSLTRCFSWCCSQPSPRAGRCRWWPAGCRSAGPPIPPRPCRWRSTPCARSMVRSSITPSRREPTWPASGCVIWHCPMASSSR